jgi:pimeloyl-ACP methyl ester carboxylesterase
VPKVLSYIVAALVVVPLLALVIAWFVFRAPDRPAAELEARYVGPSDHFAEFPGGIRLHYRDQGSKDKPVLLLLHGYGDSYATWEGWGRVLEDRYRVISLDLPGHGLTAAPADYQLDSDAYARLVADFAMHLKLPPFALAGSSMGGGVAWKLALLSPERLRALVLVGAAGWPAATTQGQSPSLAFRVLQHPIGRWVLARIDNTPLIKQGLKAQFYNKALITPELVQRWADYQRYPGHRTILMSAAPSSHSQATVDKLAAIKLPTLVLHGEYDPLIQVENGRKFASAIAGAQLITYPEAGHLPQREIPEKSAADVAAFLARLP